MLRAATSIPPLQPISNKSKTSCSVSHGSSRKVQDHLPLPTFWNGFLPLLLVHNGIKNYSKLVHLGKPRKTEQPAQYFNIARAFCDNIPNREP